VIRAVTFAFALLALPALAQNNDWSITLAAGEPVMEEISPLTFRVTNAATSRDSIASFSIGIPNGPYDIDGATAPPGWRAQDVDRKNRVITFRATNACTVARPGLAPGQSALFEVRVIGVSTNPDQPNQDLQKNRTNVIDVCSTGRRFRDYSGTRNWTLRGLGARMFTNVRALDIGDQLTLSLTVTNVSSNTQSNIVPVAPSFAGNATFAFVSGPNPPSVSNLGVDQTATFTWVYRATGRGTARVSGRAGNGPVNSPLVTTQDLNVSSFPAAVVVTPASVVVGGTVTLQVLPTNNGTQPLSFLTPQPVGFTSSGTATATQLTGPTPSNVDALSSRATTAFTTTWRVNGAVGERGVFTGRVQATDSNGATVLSDPVSSDDVVLREFTISASPSAFIAGATNQQITYSVSNGSNQAITSVLLLTPDSNLFRTPTAATPPSGWTSSVVTGRPGGIRFTASPASVIPAGGTRAFTINFASIGSPGSATPTSHKASLTLADTTVTRAEATVTVVTNRVIPDVLMPVLVATPGRVHFTWSNPVIHDGVLVLRSQTGPPNTLPQPGRRYPPGSALGNATVVYEDSFSFNTSFADTGLTNGVSYHYRIFNRDEYGIYAAGNTPTVAPNNALLVITPGTGPSDALWCSTTGLPSLQQPFTDLGKAIYQSTNASYFTANLITVGAPINGNEKWRPSQTRGVVQARPTAQRVGTTEPQIFVGDQLGYAYRVDGATGAIRWTGNGGVALGEVIQAQSLVILRQYATPAFQARYATDLAIFATRNSTNRASNSVRALRVDTGAQVFSYQPGNLDQVTGTPLFDIARNALWIPSLKTAGPSLRVIDVLNPTAAPLLTVTDLADVPTSVVNHGQTNTALVADRTGVVRGYSLPSRAQLWQINAGGAVTQPLVPYQADFFVSTASSVSRYRIDPATNVVTTLWTTGGLRLPSSVRVDAATGKLYLGDADGFLRRLDLATGAIEASVRVSTVGGVSMPSLDSTTGLKRVYLGTADGRLCAYPPTF
jgi:hypothetical protein